MPDQLDQPGSTATEGVNRPIKRVLQQAPLHQHRQSHGPFAHISHATGQVNPTTRRQSDHRSVSALRTRRNARTSTDASTRTKTPLGSTISISPSCRDDDGGGAAGTVDAVGAWPSASASAGDSWTRAKLVAAPVTTLTWPPRTCWRHEYSRPLLIAYLRATSVGVSSELKLSATIARFCSGVQIRRRSRVRSSTRSRPVPLRPIVRASSASATATSGDRASMTAFDHDQAAIRNTSPPHRLRADALLHSFVYCVDSDEDDGSRRHGRNGECAEGADAVGPPGGGAEKE